MSEKGQVTRAERLELAVRAQVAALRANQAEERKALLRRLIRAADAPQETVLAASAAEREGAAAADAAADALQALHAAWTSEQGGSSVLEWVGVSDAVYERAVQEALKVNG